MKRILLLAAFAAAGCGGDTPAPAKTDPAALQKAEDELKAQQKDLSRRKVKEGIPPEEK